MICFKTINIGTNWYIAINISILWPLPPLCFVDNLITLLLIFVTVVSFSCVLGFFVMSLSCAPVIWGLFSCSAILGYLCGNCAVINLLGDSNTVSSATTFDSKAMCGINFSQDINSAFFLWYCLLLIVMFLLPRTLTWYESSSFSIMVPELLHLPGLLPASGSYKGAANEDQAPKSQGEWRPSEWRPRWMKAKWTKAKENEGQWRMKAKCEYYTVWRPSEVQSTKYKHKKLILFLTLGYFFLKMDFLYSK